MYAQARQIQQDSWKYVEYLKDYCANCTIAGLSYISNHKLHFSERLFWLVCLVVATLGSYSLINQYHVNFDSKAASIVYESVQPNDRIPFPSLSVCDTTIRKEINILVTDYVKTLGNNFMFEVEAYVAFIVYPTDYVKGIMSTRCKPYEDCADCTRCPLAGYRHIMDMLSYNCSEFFVECSYSGRPLDCCRYFLPMVTPFGKCFLLNSLLNNKPKSGNWLNTDSSAMDPVPAAITVVANRPLVVNVLNSEDIPHKSLPCISVTAKDVGQHKMVHFFVENMVNDPDVREVTPDSRKCRYPDELLPDSVYKAYSFSTCVSDCIRIYQYRICNCSMYTLLPTELKRIPDCDIVGYYCLEKHGLIEPDIKLFLPWSNNIYTCDCLPSCTENHLRLVHETTVAQLQIPGHPTARAVSVQMPILPTERYRRQALRTRLDIIVTIGGILGLFMGASVLSGIELLHYFTIRLYNTFKRR